MHLQTLLCVTVLLSNVTGCQSVVGGRDAHRGAWPWMVSLGLCDDKEMCGGSLISDQWVLTARGCLREKFSLEHYCVLFGELSLEESSGKMVKLKRLVLHEDDGTSNDIALIQLQEPVSFSDTVAPASLPSPRDAFSPDSECWVTGWGRTDENKTDGTQTLQEVQVYLTDEASCLKGNPDKSPRELCAGDPRGGKDACMGDAGGPLVCIPDEEQKRRFVQVGITSSGRGCGRVGHPGVYTDVFSYTRFIRDTIRERECNDIPHFEACFS